MKTLTHDTPVDAEGCWLHDLPWFPAKYETCNKYSRILKIQQAEKIRSTLKTSDETSKIIFDRVYICSGTFIFHLTIDKIIIKTFIH